MADKIILDDGCKTYTIENKQGKKLGEFTFNPADTNILTKYEDVVAKIQAIGDELKEEEGDTAVQKADALIKEQIDYLFNCDASSTLFSVCGPCTPLASGELFINSVINAIGTVLEKELSARTKKMQAAADKYTKKYES